MDDNADRRRSPSSQPIPDQPPPPRTAAVMHTRKRVRRELEEHKKEDAAAAATPAVAAPTNISRSEAGAAAVAAVSPTRSKPPISIQCCAKVAALTSAYFRDSLVFRICCCSSDSPRDDCISRSQRRPANSDRRHPRSPRGGWSHAERVAASLGRIVRRTDRECECERRSVP